MLTNMMYHFKIRFILSGILFIFQSSSLWGQCSGNLISNGSFTSVEGEGVVAPGWIGGPIPNGSPDINDEFGPLNTSPGYFWVGIPLASPDGSTWQNLYGNETVSQTVLVSVGQPYQFCMQYASQKFTGTTGYVAYKLYLNNNLVYTAPIDSSYFSWENACYSFIATDSILNLKIGTVLSGFGYLAIDGGCLNGIVSGVNAIEANQYCNVNFNAGNKKIMIQCYKNEDYRFTLYNLQGRIIQEFFIIENSEIALDSLQQGIYFYEITSGKKFVENGKIFVP